MSPVAVVAGEETTLVVRGRSLTNDGIRYRDLANVFSCFLINLYPNLGGHYDAVSVVPIWVTIHQWK